MGLDQYAYSRPSRKRKSDNDIQIAEWRKHNRLQGWMQDLWESKGCPNEDKYGDDDDDDAEVLFNCVPLQLTEEDIYSLEDAILNFEFPESNGFFWGSDSYFWTNENDEPFPENEYYYQETDLKFIKDARKALKKKHKIFYSCWY
jgi:hypothetical protein|tara:strand:+ start:173 stop:607 length:435 start_codon:yes stop_codon:yes gene_type:complete